VSQFVDPSVVMMSDQEPIVHPVESLSIHAVLDGELLDVKYRAVMRQESQVGPLVSLTGADGFRKLLAEEAFRDARLEG
jgi:hypothetical protein